MTNPLDYLYIALMLLALVLSALGIYRAQKRELKRLKESFGKRPTGNAPDMESVRAYFDAVKDESAPTVDDTTWNDLELDAVFCRVDACGSSVGQEYLYAMLRRPEFEAAKRRERESLIAFFEREPELRFAAQRALMNLGKQRANALSSFVYGGAAPRAKSFSRIYRILAALPILSAALFFVNMPLATGAVLGFSTLNCIIYIYQKSRMDAKFVTLRYMTALFGLCKTLSSKRFARLPCAGAIRKNFAPFARVAGKMASTYFTQKMGGELQPVADLLKMIVLYDVVRFDQVTEAAQRNRAEFRALFEAVGELDACISILSFRHSLPNTVCRSSMRKTSSFLKAFTTRSSTSPS